MFSTAQAATICGLYSYDIVSTHLELLAQPGSYATYGGTETLLLSRYLIARDTGNYSTVGNNAVLTYCAFTIVCQ
jgi:hypothetical protein